MLRQAKLLMLGAMRETGAMRVISGLTWRKRKLLVLCYHGISLSDEHLWNPGLFMPGGMLEKRLRRLREGGFHVLPLGEAVERLRRGDLPPRAVTLTFDDGFADFYYQAYPLLRSYGLPATVYLTTYYCYYNRPIFGLITHYLLWRAKEQGRVTANLALGWDTAQDLATPKGILGAHALLNRYVEKREMSASAKEEVAQALASHLGIDYGEIRSTHMLTLMKPDQVAEIHKNGISVELHTHRHRTPRDPALLAREIRENREKIQGITGESPKHFCYPSGVWRSDMFPVLEENGVASATTCDPGLANSNTPPLLLPRYVDTTTQTDAEFDGWLSGVCQFLPRKSYSPEI